MSQEPREEWSGRLGFILAAVGSAVGLGNMWRFSYLTSENGGGAFVLLYLLLTLLLGLPVMLAELSLGRGSGRGPVSALRNFGGRRWSSLGALFVLSGFVILSYYSVIAGWTLRYVATTVAGGFPADGGEFFTRVSEGNEAAAYHVVFMIITMAVVMGGIRRGIERTALILMPVLFALIGGLAIYAFTLDGAGEGYRFYLQTDFSQIMDPDVIRQAAGQAFFSLSLGMGAIMTYGSYLSGRHHLPQESLVIGGADFMVAFVAGLAVFPMIFALGIQSDVSGSSVGTLFIALPTAFQQMGTAGTVVQVVFFIALFVAALTSAISMLEVVVASAMDSLKFSRKRATLIAGTAITLCGILPAKKQSVLEITDMIVGDVLLVAGGLALAIFVGWHMRDPIDHASEGAADVRWFPVWRWLLRVPIPLILLFVLYNSIKSVYAAIIG